MLRLNIDSSTPGTLGSNNNIFFGLFYRKWNIRHSASRWPCWGDTWYCNSNTTSIWHKSFPTQLPIVIPQSVAETETHSRNHIHPLHPYRACIYVTVALYEGSCHSSTLYYPHITNVWSFSQLPQHKSHPLWSMHISRLTYIMFLHWHPSKQWMDHTCCIWCQITIQYTSLYFQVSGWLPMRHTHKQAITRNIPSLFTFCFFWCTHWGQFVSIWSEGSFK